MVLETQRLILRPWRDTDAKDLYTYAKDERIGPQAGWPPHESEGQSLEIIKTVFAHDGVFAVCLKEDDIAIGCVGLMIEEYSNFEIGESEAEVSYWIGVPFWGKGLIPEAVREILRYGFEDLKLKAIWCGYFDGNTQSMQVQQKCGFTFSYSKVSELSFFNKERRLEHLNRITKEEWELGLGMK